MFSRKRSLARTVASFNRIIAELEALDSQHATDHQKHDAEIARLTVARDNLIAERRQAEVIATNLRSLMGRAA